MRRTSQAVWLLTGAAWAFRSLLELARPAYRDPVSLLDWTAVWSFSACWLLLGTSILLVGRLVPGRAVLIVAVVVALGGLVAGIANGIEDGLGIRAWGTVYVAGSLTALFGVGLLAAAVGAVGARTLAAWCVVLMFGLFLFVVGGGVIVLAVFAALAIRPSIARLEAAPATSG